MCFTDLDCSWDLVFFYYRLQFSRKICAASLSLLLKEPGVLVLP